jgi:hypothetical protein
MQLDDNASGTLPTGARRAGLRSLSLSLDISEKRRRSQAKYQLSSNRVVLKTVPWQVAHHCMDQLVRLRRPSLGQLKRGTRASSGPQQHETTCLGPAPCKLGRIPFLTQTWLDCSCSESRQVSTVHQAAHRCLVETHKSVNSSSICLRLHALRQRQLARAIASARGLGPRSSWLATGCARPL